MDTPVTPLPAHDDTALAEGARRALDYHRRTEHRSDGYARGPETLDWDAQPAPFRHYPGCPARPLPLVDDILDGRTDPDLKAALARPFDHLGDVPPVPVTIASLGTLLQLSLGVTAWKSLGPDRWAVRANPSSGNLHPVEGWLITRGVDALEDGVHHYRPEDHALELRASDRRSVAGPQVHIALSSAMWREAWKYGERAFRYCQLDVGHAVGCLRYAAALLGWRLRPASVLDAATLAARLGLDRAADYPARRHAATEQEEAELVLTLEAPALDGAIDPGDWRRSTEAADWYGHASELDPRPFYRWPAVDAVARDTRSDAGRPPAPPVPPASPRRPSTPRSAQTLDLILGRRSAQRYDPAHTMPRATLVRLIDALMRVGAPPLDVLPECERLDLLLMVHRVQGLEPGVYLLPRARGGALLAHLSARHPRLLQPGPVAGSPLRCVATFAPARLAAIARGLHCRQAIAADACLTVAMLADLPGALGEGADRYRTLHRAAGLLGQVLYLEAGAEGLSGTGIGCFLDGPVRDFCGLDAGPWTSLYHFAIGKAVVDPRIESRPAYGIDRLDGFAQE
ncbi:MAG: SagB/ThcOx family dehydrogenase [Rhodocyclaceae bacterium]|nr:SagB/ThcOx family dehydrogenase [Rhodocyclaceae bacterium]